MVAVSAALIAHFATQDAIANQRGNPIQNVASRGNPIHNVAGPAAGARDDDPPGNPAGPLNARRGNPIGN